MNAQGIDIFFDNIIDQVKEAQLKLGYAKETIRLYYQISSLKALTGKSFQQIEDWLDYFDSQVNSCGSNTFAGIDKDWSEHITFKDSMNRLEVRVLPELVECIHCNVADNAFLKELIELFFYNHHASIDVIKKLFEKYDSNYVIEIVKNNPDFDYVIYFSDKAVDKYYYLIKAEGGHSTYHRFMEADYLELCQ